MDEEAGLCVSLPGETVGVGEGGGGETEAWCWWGLFRDPHVEVVFKASRLERSPRAGCR